MKVARRLCVAILLAAMMLATTVTAFARDNTLPTPPQLTIRFAPSPGTFPEGISGVRTGFFGFRIDDFPEPIPPIGYRFIGWFSDGKQMNAPIAAMRSTTILAGYAPIINPGTAPSFAVVYDPGVGQLPQATPLIQSFTYGSAITSLPIPILDDYYFEGWEWNGYTVTAPYIVRSDMVLEAIWSATPLQQSSRPIDIPDNQFAAVFNPFPGAFSGSETGIRFGHPAMSIEGLPEEPLRQGYIFYGWRLPNGGIFNTLPAMSGDIMLTAIWQEDNGADTTLRPPQTVDTRPNPLTSPTNPTMISLMIFGAVLLVVIAVIGIYRLNIRHIAAEGRYHSYITRCAREMKIVIRSRSK